MCSTIRRLSSGTRSTATAVGKILTDDRDVNLALVRDGMCWWYRKYAGEQSTLDRGLYEAAETAARDKRRGLWTDPDPVPPWEWRRH